MVDLGFDEDWFVETGSMPPWPSRAVPVWLRIGGLNILCARGRPLFGTHVPTDVLELARFGMLALRQAATYGRAYLDVGEGAAPLIFRGQADRIAIHSRVCQRTGRARSETLLVAWDAFAGRLRRQVLTKTPAFLDKSDPHWEHEEAVFPGTVEGWRNWVNGADEPLRPFDPGGWKEAYDLAVSSIDADED